MIIRYQRIYATAPFQLPRIVNPSKTVSHEHKGYDPLRIPAMKRNLATVAGLPLESRILTIRGERVILDADLAEVYGVSTKALNQAVKRNADRFPPDFSFVITAAEKSEVVTICDHLARLKFSPVAPRAFTEHGAIMAANVLNSSRAIQMSVFVIRAFLKMRAALGDTRVLAKKLSALEQELMGRLDLLEAAIVGVLQRVMRILDPPAAPPEPAKPEIGFHIKEDTVPYRVKRKPARI